MNEKQCEEGRERHWREDGRGACVALLENMAAEKLEENAARKGMGSAQSESARDQVREYVQWICTMCKAGKN